MGVQQMVHAGIVKMAATSGVAATGAAAAANEGFEATETGAAETTMAAKIYAWYSSLGPWAIPAAAATIAAVMAAIGSIGKRELGGPVESGAPYIVGERGPEIFTPTQSGSIIPHGLTSQIRGLHAGMAASQAQTRGYQTARFAPAGGPSTYAQQGGIHNHFEGAMFASTTEGQRAFDDAINSSNQRIGRYQG
jgi:phage-related minor tail protein